MEFGGSEGRAEFEALRLRVERLERELAALREGAAVAAVPPPPLVAVSRAEVGVAASAPLRIDVAASSPPVASGFALEPARTISLEDRLGSQVFNWIGMVALLVGTAWFLKLAIDNHWIGPVGRTVAGLVAGTGIILGSERFRRSGAQAFAYSLKAVGGGVLYLTLWAAFQVLHLLPAGVALGGMLLVTAWNAYMAWAQDAELLAAYALIGGLATPLLLSSGGSHEVFLFTYLLAIDAATVVLIRLRGWPRLVLGTFPGTVLYFIGWYSDYFRAADLGVTALFLVLFGVVFVGVSVGRRGEEEGRSVTEVLTGVLLPVANAAFVALGLYSVLQDSGHHAVLAWLMVALAAVYLGVMRLPQRALAAAIHLSLAIVFLTIAIPLKASGHWITVAWLVEGVALFWVSTRMVSGETAEATGLAGLREEAVVRGLAVAALGLGFAAVVAHGYWFGVWAYREPAGFFNHDLGTALVGVGAFGVVAWLAGRQRRRGAAVALAALMAVGLLGILISLREVLGVGAGGAAFLHPEFAMALVGIAVLGAEAWAAARLGHDEKEEVRWGQLAGASVVALNLVAVVAGVREIAALWRYQAGAEARDPSHALKEALAVSGFLMVYSAGLLLVGFWRRAAAVRWQGLVLLVFTIAKTFLWDIGRLSQGYRVVSFLGLGVLLMGVSFAYQRDWLSLREPAVSREEKL